MLKKYHLSIILLFLTLITLSSCNNPESGKINFNLISGKYSSELVSQVNDMTQKGNIIYIANKTQLVSYNVSEGTEAVFNITFSDLSFIDSDDTYIYAYDKAENCLYTIDDSGNVTDSIIISEMKDAVKIYDFAVADDYFIFYTAINKQNSFFIIHRIDGQTEMVKSNRSVSSVISYKDNNVLFFKE